MNRPLAAALALLAFALPARAAEDPALPEIRRAFTACEAARKQAPDAWIGWRRSFFNGYGDDFAFWDNRGIERPSSLVVGVDIDGIARQVDTSCFRPNGTLAFVYTVMTAPRVDGDGAHSADPALPRREGRIYVDPKGRIVQTLGWIADAKGKRAARLDDPAWTLARGCRPVILHRSIEAVEAHYVSVMGDIEGNRPAFQPEDYDWCAAAKPE